jgi:AraC-like DNA-binding protein
MVSMQQQAAAAEPFRVFKGEAAAPLTGRLGGAEVAFTRVGLGRNHDRLHVEIGQRDAFYLIYQLRDQPPHPHWAGGRFTPAPASPRASVHIADLNAAPAAILDGRFDSLNVCVPRAFLDRLAEDCESAPVGTLQVPEPWRTGDSMLAALEPVLLAALADPASVSQLFVDHLALTTMLHVAGRYGGLRQASLRSVRQGGLAAWQERRACERIAASLAKEVTLDQVAAECGLSTSHFSKAFKHSVGMTPHGWLQARRIERAQGLLRQPETPFADIAAACGFADQSHFNRVFKRATGMTPGMWRRSRMA